MRRIRTTVLCAGVAVAAAIALSAATPGNTPSSQPGGDSSAAAAMLRASPPAESHSAATTEGSSSASYVLDWYSINGGGAVDATSPTYRLNALAAQSIVGAASSPSYQVGIGFAYGASACFCPCSGDPQCDGVRNVQDVVQAVNVAFRGYAPVVDPNCPRQRTDVNCDGVTTVQDVVKFVNVAFRGANPATEFCNPCL